MRTALSVCLLALALMGGPAAAQVVRGLVLEEATQIPIQGAMIVLLEADGRVAQRVLTGGTGQFIMQAGHVGSYRIRVDRIGYMSLTTGPFEVPVDGTYQRIAVPIKPVQLAGIDVEGSRRCALPAEQGQATARVWEEARKALEAAAWTLKSGVYRYTLLQFERTLSSDGRKVTHETRRFERGTWQAPYVSVPPEELASDGFVRANPDRTYTYFAPDAEALLSDEFLDSHCMSLDKVEDGMVGLAFQPVRGRRVPGIKGTLWIDQATAELRRLEFFFVNLPSGLTETSSGGEVLFSALPNGTWVVREWSIRMPRGTISPNRQRVIVTGYTVQGGEVWNVMEPGGRLVLEAQTATLSGTVVDSADAVVEGAVVELEDSTARRIETHAGTFLLTGLPPGLHSFRVHHPSLDSLGLGPTRSEVFATAGEVASARLRLPGVAEVLADACSDSPPLDVPAAMLLVRVRRGDAPAEGLEVRVGWLNRRPAGYDVSERAAPPLPGAPAGPRWQPDPVDPRTLLTTLDHRGIFLLCAVPTRTQVRVEWGHGMNIETYQLDVIPDRRAIVVSLRARQP